MEELAKQVKNEMVRTFIWLLISLGAGIAIYFALLK